jgi:hypothetical protein
MSKSRGKKEQQSLVLCEYTRVRAGSPVSDHRLHHESDDKDHHREEEREQNAEEGEQSPLIPILATPSSLPVMDESLGRGTNPESDHHDDEDHHQNGDRNKDDEKRILEDGRLQGTIRS